jgi:RND family efflux transporter MFP subunit
MKFLKFLTIITVLLLLAAGGAYAWMYFSTPAAVTGVVRRGAAEKTAPANIEVTESFIMHIKSEAPGRILTGNVRVGQSVRAGDVLYKIDPKDLELDIEKTEADFKIAKERIALGSSLRFEIAATKENIRNQTRLLEQGRAAQQTIDQAKRRLDELNYRLDYERIINQQALNDLENLLKLKRRALEKTTVTVANDGTISDIDARAGDLIHHGQVLCRVKSRERLVQAKISEENFSGVRPGLPVALQLLGYGGRQFAGTVERVLPNADEKTKRYIAYLTVDIPEEQLVPGLTGEASIMVDRRENALVVERRALLGSSVFVVRDGRAVLAPVTVGFTSLDQAEILGGLQEGDAIILESPATFRNGERVRVAGQRVNGGGN